jgi:osmotically-inducible protein OsmY
MKRFIAIIGLAISLQGCFFVAGAAAGAAAIAIVYDHRTIQNSLQDTRLANKIFEKIRLEPSLRDESHIEVIVFNNVVLLIGEVPNPAWRNQAESIARSVAGDTRIYNQIVIQGPTSSLTRTSDSWLTTKIKAQMLAEKNLESSSIKVVTENGTVYLMGSVTRQQADVAVDIARNTSGTQKVIKIFQYTS